MPHLGKILNWLVNPVGAIAQTINPDSDVSRILNPADTIYHDYIDGNSDNIGTAFDNAIESGESQLGDWITTGKGGQGLSKIWDDLTGKSQIILQNDLNKQMADFEYNKNLQSIGDTIKEYEKNGINRNLIASSGSAASYQAPQLQAYSGSARIDNVLGRVGKVLGLIPAMYQATAALEGIDQARERTKQSEIKTMAMGMNLIDQGYKLGDTYLSKPFIPKFRNGMNPLYYMYPTDRPDYFYKGKILPAGDLRSYADAALKNKFDLLNSIGIKNELNSTLNSWRGYQYQLDRKYGNIGRIIGLANQGAGAVNKLISPVGSWFFK